jgi:ribosomal protein S12 methylthiotransferase
MISSPSIRVGLISLGCPKNLVDSEVMLGSLVEKGFEFSSSVDDCDIAVINTCAFIGPAQKESVDNILELVELKNDGKIKGLIVMGCLSQKYGDELKKEIPEIDAIVGTGEYSKIVPVAEKVMKGERSYEVAVPEFVYNSASPRIQLTSPHTAYLKVSEGCNHTCSFCVIPQLRGKHRSRTIPDIVIEATAMVERGVREINLIAQDLTYFGMDTEGKLTLPDLIEALDEIPGIGWIRLYYAYPSMVTQRLIDTIAKSKHVCRYLDVPLQHASDKILKSMRRGTDQAKTEKMLADFRAGIPGLSVRSTFIVGFPGETDEDFDILLDFIKRARFDKLGVFTFSDEKDATSYPMTDKVSEKTMQDRKERLMIAPQEASVFVNQSLVGREYDLLIDIPTNEEGVSIGRTYRDAPDIDGKVFLKSEKQYQAGDLVPVRITRGMEYDLEAEDIL